MYIEYIAVGLLLGSLFGMFINSIHNWSVPMYARKDMRDSTVYVYGFLIGFLLSLGYIIYNFAKYVLT